ncbi:hypothetical protein BCF46_0473 [Litoreibacter meonggei]|uniref:Uncharacterized protein n=1 Tax=Litoreibacter meonggei TaxID=1049199 RepID=A0A497X4X9_9RHOB|nr:hypothetical protein [Litoreibacter meonggei]RLJ60275.1 hypothetical protein BCF46_0473 [Litoreibacter meonggei]
MRQGVAALGAAFVLCLPSWANADWLPLTGAEIDTALRDRGLIYENATQHFYASGRTLYTSGRDSWGYWRVEEDTYCSQWPPADGWACYSVARRADNGALKFIGDSGAETVGIYSD